MTEVVHTRAELAAALARLPRPHALVPTMGALHEGHLELVRRARERHETVVVSVFVNPLQFGDAADLARYPRTLDADVAALEPLQTALVWAPGVDDVYPDGEVSVRVDPGPLGTVLEGASRPGHFAGALTVVAKLFGTVRPESAFFGEKDYQQLVLVGRMVRDLDLGVDVVGVPTHREDDGLARSSRNVFLDDDGRRTAGAFAAALRRGADAGDDAVAVARAALADVPGLEIDYIELRSPDLGPAPGHGPARLLGAVKVGSVRLIDNLPVTLA